MSTSREHVDGGAKHVVQAHVFHVYHPRLYLQDALSNQSSDFMRTAVRRKHELELIQNTTKFKGTFIYKDTEYQCNKKQRK